MPEENETPIVKEAVFGLLMAAPYFFAAAALKLFIDAGTATVGAIGSLAGLGEKGKEKGDILTRTGRGIGTFFAKAQYPDLYSPDSVSSDITADDIRLYNVLKLQTEALKHKLEQEKIKRKIWKKTAPEIPSKVELEDLGAEIQREVEQGRQELKDMEEEFRSKYQANA